MKVVHVEAGRHLYGGALQVKYLLQGLRKYSVDNVLVCNKDSAIAKECQGLAVIHELSMRGDLDFRWARDLEEILRDDRPDYLHVHSRRGADFWGLRAARRCGVPLLVTRRVDNAEPRWFAKWKYNRNALHVFSISEGIRDVLLGQGVDRRKVTTIHSAVDTEHFQPQPDADWFNQEFGFQPGNIVAGIVGQLIERKGHKHLFNVLPALRRQFPDLRLVVLGQGPLEQTLKEHVQREGMEGIVTFAGFRRDIERILPNLQLVIHPALKEGLGVSLLQASACGVPVIASDTGGIPEAVLHTQTGLLCAPGSEPELLAAVQRLLQMDDSGKCYGENGREYVTRQFSVESMTRTYVNFYERLGTRHHL